MTIHNSTIKSK